MFELLKDKSFYKRTLRILLPVAAQQLISIGVSTADSLMIGSFGEVQISATSLANSLMTLFFFMFMGLGTGSTTLAAQFWGKKDRDSLRAICGIALRIAFCLGVAFSLLALLAPGGVMRFMTNDERIIEKGISYLRILGFIFPFSALATASTYLLRSTGHTKMPLLGSIGAFFINIFFNWVFIFGKLGAPRMEIAGAALGTLIARIFEFCMSFGYLIVFDKNIRMRFKDIFIRNAEIFKKFMKFSLPVVFSDTMLGLGLNLQNVIVGHMGGNLIAARSVVFVLSQFVTIFNMGLSSAAGVVIGNTIGERKPERAFKEGVAYIVISIAIGIVGMVFVLSLSPYFVNIKAYNFSETTRSIARELFLCISVTMPLQTLAYVTSKGILRGAGDTRFIALADILLLWVVSLPLGALTGFVLHWRPFWMYFFLTIEYPLKGIWCTLRFLSGKSIKDVTKKSESETLATDTV